MREEEAGKTIAARRGPDAKQDRLKDVVDRAPVGLTRQVQVSPKTAEDGMREFLRELWGNVNSGAPGQEEFLEWASGLSPEEVFPSLLRAGSAAEGTLAGAPQEAIVRAMVDVSEAQHSLATLRTYLSGPLARTLRRWEEAEVATAEQRIDLIVQPLARADIPLVPGNEARRFVLGMYAYLLHRQPPERRDLGFWSTVTSLAGWLIRTRERSCQVAGICVYHAVLAARDDRSLNLAAGRELVRNVANNTVSALADLGDSSTLALGSTLNRVHTLSVLATEVDAANPELVRLALEQFLELPAVDPGTAIRHAAILSSMMHVPPAWRFGLERWLPSWQVPTPWNHLAAMEVLAGLVRTGLVKASDLDDVGSAFFNAAVSLSRHKRAAAVESSDDEAEWLQALSAGAGLYLVVRLSADVPTALDRLNGMMCAVNLFGAASNLHWAEPEQRAAFGRLAAALRAHSGVTTPENWFRIQRSLADLGFDSASLTTGDEVEVAGAVHDVMRLLSEREGLGPWPDVQMEIAPSILALCKIMRAAFARSLGNAWPQHKQQTVTLLAALDAGRGDLAGALREFYGPLMAPPEPGEGPLVAAGIVNQDEWRALCAEASRDVFPSLADALVANVDVITGGAPARAYLDETNLLPTDSA